MTNYKLKHSRLLTCYSALLYLLAVFEEKACVTPQDAKAMISLTPTQRLEWLLKKTRFANAHEAIAKLLERYDLFLKTTNAPEAELVKQFLDKSVSREYMKTANTFGDSIFDVLSQIGGNGRFYRLLVV